jgi:hypothetical protein
VFLLEVGHVVRVFRVIDLLEEFFACAWWHFHHVVHRHLKGGRYRPNSLWLKRWRYDYLYNSETFSAAIGEIRPFITTPARENI